MISFDEYVRLNGARLVRVARLLVRDRHLAEDLVQDVLAKAFVRWSRIVGAGDPDLYLRRMLVNATISWRRRRSSGEIAVATDAIEGPADTADIGGAAAERDAAWRLVAALPPRQRATIVLRYYEDLDDASIAEILQCSPATVRSQTMRALATLRERSTGRPVDTRGGTAG